MQGTIKTCTVKREGEQWYAVFTIEYEHDPSLLFHPSLQEVGIDLGINTFAALSDGTVIENLRFYRKEEARMKEAHKKIHRRKKGSHRRARAKKELSRLYRKVRHRRRDFLHKASRQVAEKYAVLVFEDLQIDNMTRRPKPKQDCETKAYVSNGASAKGGLNKSILDAGWGEFVSLCACKVEETGGTLVKVPPKNTSQECSGCQELVPKALAVRWHSCPHCGTELDRDENAARVILARYQSLKQKGAGRVPQDSHVESL